MGRRQGFVAVSGNRWKFMWNEAGGRKLLTTYINGVNIAHGDK